MIVSARKYMTAFAAAALVAVAVSACGGGPPNNGPPPPPPTVSLPAGHEIPADTYTIPAGDERELGNVTVSCPSGGMACVLTVASSTAETGTYERTGGKPTFMAVLGTVDLPGGHDVGADTYTIPAGDDREHGNVTVSCPANGRACDLTVASSTAETGTYPKTGGTPTVAPALGTVILLEGHNMPISTTTIVAGEERELGHLIVSCPANGRACDLTVASPTAETGTYPKTGGTPPSRRYLST